MTVSPSISRISRSTPCVDGCCGPMLTTIRSPGSPLRAASTTWFQSWPMRAIKVSEPSSCAVFMASSSVVGPPLVGRGNLRALVFHRDAAERVVLALRMSLPVVGHLDAGQRRVAVEDDAEEVVGLALVPVVGRVDREQRGDVRVTVWRSNFQSDATAMGDRAQRVHPVQLASGFVRVVHAVDAQAQLEAQVRVVAKPAGDPRQELAPPMHRQL